jgi:hypothetical protein
VVKAVWTVQGRLAAAFAVAWFALTGMQVAAQQASPAPGAITSPSTTEEQSVTITVQIEPPPISIPSAAIGISAPLGAESAEGKPIMAEFVTEIHQIFNGTSITRSTPSIIYRDRQGRVRREAQLLFPGLPAGVTAKLVTIMDRHQGFGWVLDPQDFVAHRYRLDNAEPSYIARLSAQGSGGQLLPPPRKSSADSGAKATAKSAAESRRWLPHAITPPMGLAQDSPEDMSSDSEAADQPEENGFNGVRGPFVAAPNRVRTENLGEQMILGYHVFGTRVITTLQPGEIGNESPIDVVSEQWFSPELELVMRSLHRDPWGGEITTAVTKVRRGEQSAELFTVPAQYKLIDADTEDERHVLVNGRETNLSAR